MNLRGVCILKICCALFYLRRKRLNILKSLKESKKEPELPSFQDWLNISDIINDTIILKERQKSKDFNSTTDKL